MANVAPCLLEASPPYPDGDLREGGVAIISLSAWPCARLIGMCPAAFQSVSGQCKVSWNDITYALTHRAKITKGAKGARICQHPEYDDLCMTHHGYAGCAGRDARCESSGGLMHVTPSTCGTRLLFMGNLLVSNAPSSSKAPKNTSQVFPTLCRCLSCAFMRV
jgi:hypothetical protein